MNSLYVQNLGDILKADISFGDLTVLFGSPKADARILLQTLKLLIDKEHTMKNLMDHYNPQMVKDHFMELFFGRSPKHILRSNTVVKYNGRTRNVQSMKTNRKSTKRETCLYIPSNRTDFLNHGITHPFCSYTKQDPYVVKNASNRIHCYVQSKTSTKTLFPSPSYDSISDHDWLGNFIMDRIYDNLYITFSNYEFSKQIVLQSNDHKVTIPYPLWRESQKQFTCILLSFLSFLSYKHKSIDNNPNMIIIEEPENCLDHTSIEVFILLLLYLLEKGYQIFIYTNSFHLLDIIYVLWSAKDRNPQKHPDSALSSDVYKRLTQLRETVDTKTCKMFAFTNSKTSTEIQNGSDVRSIYANKPTT